ncbi:MAG: DNA mismatch repair protein MutS [Tissierellia bacterium]|nr:DNA mismatch repair protein MutS [Tissierellia bacterium]
MIYFYVFLALLVLAVVLSLSNKRRIKRNLKSSWGKYPGYEFREKENEKILKESFEIIKRFHDGDKIIDDYTWNDLEMQLIFNRINKTESTIGAQALYNRLRIIKENQKDKEYLESLEEFFEKDEKKRTDCQYIFYRLGRIKNTGIFEFLNSGITDMSNNLWMYLLMGLIPLISAIVLYFRQNLIIFSVLFISIAMNMFYSINKYKKIQGQIHKINYISNSVYTAKNLVKFEVPIGDKLRNKIEKLKKIKRISYIGQIDSGSDFEYISYYLNAIFMLPLIAYYYVVKEIKRNQEEILIFLQMLGEIEVAIAVLNYKIASKDYCIPKFIDERKIRAKDIFHPMLNAPVRNDVIWNDNTLVTGSNASGKSTYVKSIAINALLSQTLYLAHAKEFSLKKGNILTSMAIKDNLVEGESYFIAEIKSLKRIVNDLQNNQSYYFVDEILKGTNTVERIAASSSIINYFVDNEALSFIATHDIELTKMHGNVRNIHFKEKIIEGDRIEFDYKVYEGPSKTTNAIKLLEIMSFPKNITDRANERADNFLKLGKWIFDRN